MFPGLSFGIDCTAYHLPENRCDLDHWDRSANPPAGLAEAIKKNGGLYYHSAGDASVDDMSVAAVGRLLEENRIDRREIDLVIYAHSLWSSVPPAPLSTPNLVKRKFGLRNACCWSIAQQACVSVLVALRLIGTLMQSRPQLNKILLFTADKIYEDSRRPLFDKGILSDGASAALVTRDSKRTVIRSVALHTDGRYHAAFKTPAELMGEANMNYIFLAHKIISRAIIQSAVERSQYDLVLGTNMSKTLDKMVMKLLKMPTDILFDRNVASKGHVCCSDAFINLADLAGEHALPWRNLVIFATGVNGSFGAATLQNLAA